VIRLRSTLALRWRWDCRPPSSARVLGGRRPVLFSPKCRIGSIRPYGGSEGAGLRQTIRERVGLRCAAPVATESPSRNHAAPMRGPTHPTDKQIGAKRSLDACERTLPAAPRSARAFAPGRPRAQVAALRLYAPMTVTARARRPWATYGSRARGSVRNSRTSAARWRARTRRLPERAAGAVRPRIRIHAPRPALVYLSPTNRGNCPDGDRTPRPAVAWRLCAFAHWRWPSLGAAARPPASVRMSHTRRRARAPLDRDGCFYEIFPSDFRPVATWPASPHSSTACSSSASRSCG